jgi:uncharacterized protein DUF4244
MSEAVTQPVGALIATVEPDAGTRAPVRRDEHGMISAEWAVGLIAAIAVAGVLLAVVTNGAVKSALLKFILMVIDAFANNI